MTADVREAEALAMAAEQLMLGCLFAIGCTYRLYRDTLHRGCGLYRDL